MSGYWIDADLSSRNRLVQADAQLGNASTFLFMRVKNHMDVAMKGARMDAATIKTAKDRFDAAVEAINTQGHDAWMSKVGRTDAVGSEGGGLFAGALRTVIGKVLEEKHPIPNLLKEFTADTSIQVGKRTFELRREFSVGSARVHRGGSVGIPTVGLANATFEQRIHNYITSVVFDVFEEMSADAANVDYAAKLLKVARNVLEAFANEMTAFGDPSYNIFGILNYPWFDKAVSPLNWYGTPTDTRTFLDALNGYFNRQWFVSKGTFSPNKMATSPRVGAWISQTLMGTTTTMRDRTLGEAFAVGAGERLEGPIKQWHEFENVLGAGIDAILFYRSDEMGIQNVLPGGGIQALPFWQDDINRRQILFFPHGGIMAMEVGNVLIVFVRAAAS